jgi:hypothetical protein
MTCKEFKSGDVWKGPAYRAESGLIIKGETAQDIVNFESYELGNTDIKQQAESLKIDLSKIQEKNVVWVTQKKDDAKYYGEPELYHIPKNSIVLATDGEGGYLIWKGGKLWKDI